MALTAEKKVSNMLSNRGIQGAALKTYTYLCFESARQILREQAVVTPRSYAAKGLMKLLFSLDLETRLDYINDVALMLAQEQPDIDYK